jgi:short-subunit dehydrogenase involved in D-alanine esterification of teichoic acids
MAFKLTDFKAAIITGGGGGIGKAFAKYFLEQNKKVIIVGRTEKNLAETSKELGDIPYYVLDTGKIKDIKPFIEKVIKEHPEVDCLINNAGVQRTLDVDKFDLDVADEEIDINQRGPLHLSIGFLPHFKSKPGAVIMNVSSVLGFVPFSVINPNYNATKAWLHFWTINLRQQLKNTNVRVIEIVPPQVETDLHRDREDPDDNKKHKGASALSLDEFIADIDKGLVEDKDTIGAGVAIKIIETWDESMGKLYNDRVGDKK